MDSMGPRTELLIIGGGIAGLSLAARAAQLGTAVVVVEASDKVGGSAALSEGFVWTASDESAFRREDPDGDVEKFLVVRSELEHAFGWVSSLGVEVGPRLEGILGFGVGRRIDIGGLLRTAQIIVEDAGGRVLLNTKSEQLVRARDRVIGARLPLPGSSTTTVFHADATVLATGGFQGSTDLREQHLRPGAGKLLLRSNGQSDGSGLRMGTAAGGALTNRTDGFYGHLVPAPLREWDASEYTLLTQYHSDHGLLLDRAGRRFCDESRGDHVNAEEVAERGPVLLLIDERIRQERVLPPFIPGMAEVDKMAIGGERGGLYAQSDSVEGVAAAASNWGYDGEGIVRTVAEFNRCIREAPHELDPPRTANRAALTRPPFALLQVQAAITFTYGGLRTDLEGRVLDSESSPIPGLYAIGVDAGGLNARGYTGGLVRGLTLGLKLAERLAG